MNFNLFCNVLSDRWKVFLISIVVWFFLAFLMLTQLPKKYEAMAYVQFPIGTLMPSTSVKTSILRSESFLSSVIFDLGVYEKNTSVKNFADDINMQIVPLDNQTFKISVRAESQDNAKKILNVVLDRMIRTEASINKINKNEFDKIGGICNYLYFYSESMITINRNNVIYPSTASKICGGVQRPLSDNLLLTSRIILPPFSSDSPITPSVFWIYILAFILGILTALIRVFSTFSSEKNLCQSN